MECKEEQWLLVRLKQPPQPSDEARTALYYLQSLASQVVPDLLAELDRTLTSISMKLLAFGPGYETSKRKWNRFGEFWFS